MMLLNCSKHFLHPLPGFCPTQAQSEGSKEWFAYSTKIVISPLLMEWLDPLKMVSGLLNEPHIIWGWIEHSFTSLGRRTILMVDGLFDYDFSFFFFKIKFQR